LRPVAGFTQSFVPFANPIKFATPIGALSGKSWQVSLPAVVSIIAVGEAGLAAVIGLFAAGFVVFAAVCDIKGIVDIIRNMIRDLRMLAPGLNRNQKGGTSIVRQPEGSSL